MRTCCSRRLSRHSRKRTDGLQRLGPAGDSDILPRFDHSTRCKAENRPDSIGHSKRDHPLATFVGAETSLSQLPAPNAGCCAELALERTTERRFGLVAGLKGDLRDTAVPFAQVLSCHLHAQKSQVMHRWLSDQ